MWVAVCIDRVACWHRILRVHDVSTTSGTEVEVSEVFIVYWGGCDGHREDYSIFYTDFEIYTTEVAANKRAEALKVANDAAGVVEEENGDEEGVWLYGFYTHIVKSEVKE